MSARKAWFKKVSEVDTPYQLHDLLADQRQGSYMCVQCSNTQLIPVFHAEVTDCPRTSTQVDLQAVRATPCVPDPARIQGPQVLTQKQLAKGTKATKKARLDGLLHSRSLHAKGSSTDTLHLRVSCCIGMAVQLPSEPNHDPSARAETAVPAPAPSMSMQEDASMTEEANTPTPSVQAAHPRACVIALKVRKQK